MIAAVRIPEYMRESVDRRHAELNWQPFEDRFANISREVEPSARPTEAPAEIFKGAIEEHCNRKTFGIKSCKKCRQEFLALSGNQVICSRNECHVRKNTQHAANHRAKMRQNKALCLHDAGWVQQAKEGRYSRYERCRKCNTGRVIGGDRIPTGKPRSAPAQEKATCQHLPEWRSNVKKNGGMYQKCKACGTIRVSLDHETKKGPKR